MTPLHPLATRMRCCPHRVCWLCIGDGDGEAAISIVTQAVGAVTDGVALNGVLNQCGLRMLQVAQQGWKC